LNINISNLNIVVQINLELGVSQREHKSNWFTYESKSPDRHHINQGCFLLR